MVPPRIRITDADLAAGALDEYAVVPWVVDPAGIPREVPWVDASDAAFARAAAKAIANSRFSPAPKGGKTVARMMETRIAYQISLSGVGRYDDHAQPTHYAEEIPIYPSAGDPFDRGTYQR